MIKNYWVIGEKSFIPLYPGLVRVWFPYDNNFPKEVEAVLVLIDATANILGLKNLDHALYYFNLVGENEVEIIKRDHIQFYAKTMSTHLMGLAMELVRMQMPVSIESESFTTIEHNDVIPRNNEMKSLNFEKKKNYKKTQIQKNYKKGTFKHKQRTYHGFKTTSFR